MSPQRSPSSQRKPHRRSAMGRLSAPLACAILVVFFLFQTIDTVAQHRSRATKSEAQALKQFLQGFVRVPGYDFKGTRYIAAFVDLNKDGIQEAIVYFTDSCGSGGCDMLILAHQNGRYAALMSTAVTRLPIRVLNTESNGWHDVAMQVAGGGVQGYEEILSFDGKSDTTNTTVSPKGKSNYGEVPGKILIPYSAKDRPLFP